MPQDPNSLLGALLRKATSMGPDESRIQLLERVNKGIPAGQLQFPENWLPNAPQKPQEAGVKHLLSRENLTLGEMPLGPMGKLGSGVVEQLEPASKVGSIKAGDAPWTLLDALRNFSSKIAKEVPEPPRLTKTSTGFRVPETAQIKAPLGFELPPTTEMPHRPLDISERLGAQHVADARILATSTGEATPLPRTASRASGETKYNRGNNWSRAKVTPDDVRDIRTLRKGGATTDAIQEKYPFVNPNTLKSIIYGDSWSWVK